LNLTPDVEHDGQQWTFLGIFAKNREEWAVADLACVRSAITIIPFFDSLGPEALTFVMNQTNVPTMCVDKGGVEHLLKISAKCQAFKNIVSFD